MPATVTGTHAVKNGRRYRYYVATARDGGSEGRSDGPTLRFSASAIELVVIRQVTAFFGQTSHLIDKLGLRQLAPDALTDVMTRAERLVADLEQGKSEDQRAILVDLVERITVGSESLRVELKRQSRAGRLLGDVARTMDNGEPVIVEAPIRVARRGVETRLVIEGESGTAARSPDPALIKAVARGYHWFEELTSGRATSIIDIAEREGVSDRFVSILLNLAFLAPSAVEAIIDGRQPAELTATGLMFEAEIPRRWRIQEERLGC